VVRSGGIEPPTDGTGIHHSTPELTPQIFVSKRCGSPNPLVMERRGPPLEDGRCLWELWLLSIGGVLARVRASS
jgi:hypothetical protein